MLHELFITHSIILFCAFLPNILTTANPEISSTKDASIFINLCSFGFYIIASLGKKGINLFKKLKHDSHEFIIPSNSNIFFRPKTKFMFHVFLILM